MKISFSIRSILGVTGALVLHASPTVAAVPTYTLTWLGLGNTPNATYSHAWDINNAGQIAGFIGQNTVTPTGPGSSSIYTNWTHGAVWSQTGALSRELPNSAFQPCVGIDPATAFCPDVTGARAINDSGLVVGIANVPVSNSYGALPSGSGWDHSYYYDSTGNGLLLPVPTPFGTAMGHYDYASDVNSVGQVIGHMDGAFTGATWATVGYVYTPGQAAVTVLAQPVFADGSRPTVVYPKGINSLGAIVGTGSYVYNSTPTQTTYGYRPVLWQNSAAGGQEIAGFSLGGPWSFAQDINTLGQIAGYSQDPTNYEFARLYDPATGNTVTLGLGEALRINADGWAAVTNFQTYPLGGAFVFVPDAPNAQTGQTCRLDANTVPSLAAADHLDWAHSINDAGLIVGSGNHNGHAEGYVLTPTATAASNPTCSPVPYGTTPTPPPVTPPPPPPVTPPVTPPTTPPVSCTIPSGAAEAAGKGKITEVGDGYIKVGSKKVNYAACTEIHYEGYANSFAVGQSAEWEGYAQGGVNTAKVITAE